MPFPAVLKPVTPLERLRLLSRTGAKAIPVPDPQHLRETYEPIESCGRLMLQELVPGDDDQNLLAGTYHDARSRPLAVFTGRKLRQHPRGFGNARAGESLWDQKVADLMLRLLAEFQYHGISEVEFKRIPGRFVEADGDQPTSGVMGDAGDRRRSHLTYLAYRDAIGRPVTAPPQRTVWAGWTAFTMCLTP